MAAYPYLLSWDGVGGDTHLFVTFSALVVICILYPFYECIFMYLFTFQNVFLIFCYCAITSV